MKRFAIPRPSCATVPAGLAVVLLFVAPPMAALAAPLPEPLLKSSTNLSLTSAVADDERALLRVEYHAARSAQEEADSVSDIIQRTQRMEGMVADIRRLMDTWPPNTAPLTPPPATPVQQPPVASPPSQASDGSSVEISPLELYGMIALAATLTFVAWLMKERHAFLKARQRRVAAESAHSASPEPLPDVAAGTAPAPFAPAPQQQKRVRPPPPAAAAEPLPAPPTVPSALPHAVPLAAAPPAMPAAVPAAAPPTVSPAVPPATPDAASFAVPPAVQPASLDFEFDGAAGNAAGTDQAIELADIMLAMGLTHGAAQTLSEQVHGHPKQALFHWLKLLDIYRSSNLRWDFEQAARDMRMFFNVQAPGWGTDGGEISIEDYPHLAAKLQSLWPGVELSDSAEHAECAEFLAQLLRDNRGGTRNGFPQSVAEEILLLQQLLAAAAPALATV